MVDAVFCVCCAPEAAIVPNAISAAKNPAHSCVLRPSRLGILSCASRIPITENPLAYSGFAPRFTIIFAAVDLNVSGTLLLVLKIFKSRGVNRAN